MKQMSLFTMLCLLTFCQRALSQTHWTCDSHAYRYDMTVYLTPYLEGKALTSLDGYEMAAFCGDECRGVVEMLSISGTDIKYGYLRIRSNTESGDSITFRLYNTFTYEEVTAITSIKFGSLSLVGQPSETKRVFFGTAFEVGDVNLDGLVNVTDVVDMKDYIIRGKTSQLDSTAADINSDGLINVTDVTDLIESIVHTNK